MTYVSQPVSVSLIMGKVLLALGLGIAAYVVYFGPAIVISLVLASVTALAAEAFMLRLRRYPVAPFLKDGSALVTAWLLALSLPALAPWWLIVGGTLFAIVVAKHLYGGLGNNLFNPAMAAYALLLVSFPAHMTQWPAVDMLAQAHLSLAETLRYIFTGRLPAGVTVDAITMATPLDFLKTQLKLGHTVHEITRAPIYGHLGGRGGEVVALAYLAGGLFLLQQRVITWHVPLAMLAALFAAALWFHVFDPDRYVAPWFHLASGGAMLGAFFIATDPVTGPTTPRGKLIFGAAIGFLVYLIRTFGGYPDGVAFAVLIMNMAVPLIDTYTQPRVIGHGRQQERP
ncbi:MAG: electron transport complex subunit RsxD [Burkholderiales bacterium]|nr:electron transport complex subunit RsxD [Burkholderiales bacterium]